MKVYRIYTEDVRRNAIVRVLSKQFENFTLQPTTGYYRGKREKSIVIEIVGAWSREIKWAAAQIRVINRQASVLVISITARAKKITTREGASEPRDQG